MDERFFAPSLLAFKGLFFYLAEDFNGAARNYRDYIKELYRTEKTAPNPGWDALLRGDFKEAEALSKKELEDDQSAIEPLLTLGEIALEKGDLNQAIDFFDRVLQIKPDQFDALLFLSIINAQMKNYGDAIDSLNRALRHYRIETRITAFFKAMEITGNLLEHPKQKRPYSLIAHYFRYFRIFDSFQGLKASSHAKKAISIGDHVDNAYLTLGILYEKKGKKEKALEAFLNSIKENPENSEAYRWASVIFSKRGDLSNEYQMRKAAYTHSLEDPFYAEWYSYFLINKLGDYHQALELAEKVLEQNPSDLFFLEKKAEIHQFIGGFGKSLDIYKKAINLNPETSSLYLGMGRVLSNLDKTQKAIEAFQKAISLDPFNGVYHIDLALSYRKQRRDIEAIQEYEKAFSFGYFNINYFSDLCAMYHETSNFQKAVNCMKQVLSIDPSNQTAQFLLPYALRNLNGRQQL